METVWHNLRKKPKSYEYVLVETYSKHYPYRVCFYFEEGFWRDAYKTSYFITKSYRNVHPINMKNDFRVKRWAYINDIK